MQRSLGTGYFFCSHGVHVESCVIGSKTFVAIRARYAAGLRILSE
jgi:carbonic anhydrase/acetyltransferase-like protein (isoleucine patch superfamily)